LRRGCMPRRRPTMRASGREAARSRATVTNDEATARQAAVTRGGRGSSPAGCRSGHRRVARGHGDEPRSGTRRRLCLYPSPPDNCFPRAMLRVGTAPVAFLPRPTSRTRRRLRRALPVDRKHACPPTTSTTAGWVETSTLRFDERTYRKCSIRRSRRRRDQIDPTEELSRALV
jgi:hypothetical protein